MAKWRRDKVLPDEINNGNEFTEKDNLTIKELNSMVNNSFYSTDFVEAMADTPEVENNNPEENPRVELVENIKNGKKYKKFKFWNIKGKKGDKGSTGEKGEKGDPNKLTIGSVTSGITANAEIKGEAPNQTLSLVLPKGEKGEQGVIGKTPNISMSIKSLPVGSEPSVTKTGTNENPNFELGIPDSSSSPNSFIKANSGTRLTGNKTYQIYCRDKYDNGMATYNFGLVYFNASDFATVATVTKHNGNVLELAINGAPTGGASFGLVNIMENKQIVFPEIWYRVIF